MAETIENPKELRARYVAAKARLEEIEARRKALLAETEEPYQAALEEMDELHDLAVGQCEGCSELIFDGEPHMPGEYKTCAECAPTWEDFQNHPETLCNAEEEPFTPETAAPLIAAHLEAGGKLTDKMVR